MARLIDADRALKIVSEQGIVHPNAYPLTNYATLILREAPTVDAVEVVHGRWIEHEETKEDAYSHHKCSECNVNALFYYKMREDWDEGMDGEWYSIGLVDDGINEYLTDYCPNCGARMDALSE